MRCVYVFLAACAIGIAHADDRSIDRKVAADPHGTVEISNVSGRIDVSGWDHAEVEVRGTLGAGAERVDVESDHGRTSIKVIVPNHSFRSVGTDLQIRIPRDSELDVSAVSADVRSTDVAGALMLKTVSGNVGADVFQGDTEIKTVSGDVSLHGRGSGGNGAQMRVQTVSGNITIEHGAGDLEATTISGDLTINLDPTRNVRLRTTSGNLRFNGKLARGGVLDTETVSGDLKVRAVPESALEYEVNTFSGEIKDCMGVEPERVSRYGPGKRLIGTHGQTGSGESRVRLKSMSGDIELCDHS